MYKTSGGARSLSHYSVFNISLSYTFYGNSPTIQDQRREHEYLVILGLCSKMPLWGLQEFLHLLQQQPYSDVN
ncbi:hypothetical protein GDO78_021747 [Eleutherodactylus coqui]|uniref:Uncharacterized protein n=1 Tax=Eleutherodactylus coqui TaxID=57060 RepID=A0A8J6E2S0_ELECQ|nr:hypothetical protein GDO78_021747 [Eleutherodactylus coqui]